MDVGPFTAINEREVRVDRLDLASQPGRIATHVQDGCADVELKAIPAQRLAHALDRNLSQGG